MQQINIDEHINWKNFYFTYLPTLKLKGDELHGLCPFHNENNPSFGIKIKTGQYKCLSCGANGNAWSFLMQHEGKSKEEATEIIYKFAGIELPREQKQNKRISRIKQPKFTLEEYACAKKLNQDLLHDYGISNTVKGMSIPYMDERGSILATRFRHSLSGSIKFSWCKGSKVHPYGLWRLNTAREKGFVFLVEGESDCHTLWQHSIPALGIPGADTFKSIWCEYLEDVDVYLVKEPDQGGDTFLKKVCTEFIKNHFAGNLFSFTIPKFKDASSLHMDSEADFIERWEAAVNMAAKVDIRITAQLTEKVIADQPFTPIKPDDYRYGNDGVWGFDERGTAKRISPVPIILTRRLLNMDTDTEKLELAFKKDGRWKFIKAEKTTVYQRNKISELCTSGLMVTSETAKDLVNYLFAMESANIDFLPCSKSVSHLGWIDNRKFLPHHAEDIVLDMEGKNEMKNMVNNFKSGGNYEEWKCCMGEVVKQPLPQFMIAASFASPLLSIIGHRNFIVHIWGASKGGKTAAMKAALSVWGEPEKIMATFNTTMVGLERMCGFLCNLPLGVDERQLAGDKQEFLDKLVYAVSAGQGKTRGDKNGGLQAKSYWNLVILTTGEESLAGDASHSGVRTRALELYGIPFANQSDAQLVHQVTNRNYGWAGKEFIAKVIEKLKTDKEFFHKEYTSVFNQLQGRFGHISQPHLSAIAISCVSYFYARQWIWEKSEDEAQAEMIQLALNAIEFLSNGEEEDYVARAWDFTTGWLASNQDRFNDRPTQHEAYGFYDDIKKQYCVVPNIYKNALQDAGFSVSRVLREFSEKGYIITETNGNKITYSIKKTWKQSRIRMIVFNVLEQESLGLT